jgi:ABC-type Mn2+/Zn2+ transport system ATPase subunit
MDVAGGGGMKPVVVARRLAVGYGTRVVLTDVDTYLEPGGSVALVGSNGSGKSTLLKTFAGLIRPLDGGLEILGAAPGRATREAAYLSQYHREGLALPIRAIDVVRMARFDQRGRLSRRQSVDDQAVADGMRRMGVEHLAERAMRDLSGGQQQRVYLAQVLARRSRLLLLDEPTSGLDAPGRALYLEAMEAERARGAVIVSATHDVGEASECERVMLLAGRVVADGPPAVVLTPENLLTTFGVGLTHVDGRLVVTEHTHDHDH